VQVSGHRQRPTTVGNGKVGKELVGCKRKCLRMYVAVQRHVGHAELAAWRHRRQLGIHEREMSNIAAVDGYTSMCAGVAATTRRSISLQRRQACM
jgi:hypothetical protein